MAFRNISMAAVVRLKHGGPQGCVVIGKPLSGHIQGTGGKNAVMKRESANCANNCHANCYSLGCICNCHGAGKGRA